MDKVIGTSLVVLLIALAVTSMIISWRKRVARDARFTVALPHNSGVGQSESAREFSVLYVATTLASNALQRVALPGLAFRADAHLFVSAQGMTIAPRGEHPTFIPAQQIVQVHRSQVTIDRVVEKDGLTAISWIAFDNEASEPIEFTSYFRISIPEIRTACEDTLTEYFPQTADTPKEVAS